MCNQIGLFYDARGDYDAALAWYQKSVAIKERLGDATGLATSYHNMAYLAKAQKNWSLALDYFTRSRDLYRKIGLPKKVTEKEALIEEVKEQLQDR